MLWVASLLVACGARTTLDTPDAHRDASADASKVDAGADGFDAPAPPAEEPVTLTTYFGDERAPLGFVAAEDGDGAWKALHSSDGLYSFDATSRYGIVYECPDTPGGYRLSFVYATREKYPALVVGCNAPPSADGGVQVTVTSLAAGEAANVAIDVGTTLWATPADQVVSRGLLLPGAHDVVVGQWSGSYDIQRIGIRRAVPVTKGGVTSLSFDAHNETSPTNAFQVAVVGKTYDEDIEVDAAFYSTTGTVARLSSAVAAGYHGVPDALIQPADLHVLNARVFDGTTRESRQIVRYLHMASNVTLTLPPLFVAGVDVATSAPYVRVTTDLVNVAGANLYQVTCTQTVPRWLSLTATADWLGGATKWEEPDLSQVEGWNDVWALKVGQTTTWSATAITSGRDPMLELEHFPISEPVAPSASWDGVTVVESSKYGWFTP